MNGSKSCCNAFRLINWNGEKKKLKINVKGKLGGKGDNAVKKIGRGR